MTAPDLRRSLRTADLLALGITKRQLRGPGWQSPHRGVHVPASEVRDMAPLVESHAPEQRILNAAELIPAGGAIAGWAAARLLGVPELDGRGRSGREMQPVIVLVPEYARHVAPREGVIFRRSLFSPADATEIKGVRITTALRSSFDLMRWSFPEDALVVGDLMARRLGVEPAAVAAYADEHRRFRGVPVVRRTGPFIDPLSRSTGETRMRYLWIFEAGLPRPMCNPLVVDSGGAVVAMPDLLDVETGLVGEYDGATHRDLAQHTEDNAREEDFEARGLVVVRATSLDLGRYRDRTVSRLRDGAHRAAEAAATGPSRWGWRPGRVWAPPTRQPDW